MKKTTQIRKLTLNRETISPLELEQVNGGAATSAIVRATWNGAKAAGRWVSQHMCGALTVESVAESARRTAGGDGNK
jgi:hypothetical protein